MAGANKSDQDVNATAVASAVPAPGKAKAKPRKLVVRKAQAQPVPAAAVSQSKDMTMAKTQTIADEFTAKAQEAFAEAQDRAKTAYEKGTALFADAGEFNKGNVEALVESGKVLAAGLQAMGKDYAAEAKTAFETAQTDVKELAAVKNPADFFKLQGEIMRRNFDAMVAAGSKHSEAMVKLANEAIAPLSTRVSLAVEKVKQAA